MKIIGREKESHQIEKALTLGKNILVEGPVGVGKTFLIHELLAALKRPYERVDGDTRYTEQKLTGWFDPPLVLKKGFSAETFVEGPLVTAMKKGKVLFVNELNRMPEAVQNILLPAMDERMILLPKLGTIRAKNGFLVVATQNPREFTATHQLSEALLDRFEMVRLGYQSREDELSIVKQGANGTKFSGAVVERAVDLIRSTREHPSIKRGASVRAAMSICTLTTGGLAFEEAVLMALPSRIEMVSMDEDVFEVLHKLVSGKAPSAIQKKN